MSPLHHLSTVSPEKWRAQYRQDLAAGCGHVIGVERERLAAPEELVGLALHRDRVAVPGELADALGTALVLHVAGAGEVG